MKTKIYSLLIICAALLFSGQAKAQCGMRYTDSLFQVSITTVSYDDADSLMDIYQPIGDTSSHRPVIVLCHEGTFDSGDKSSDYTVTRLCNLYAQRGYVVASINYRLMSAAVLAGSVTNHADSVYIITEVIQALSDGKAAIRFFSKDAATANTYKIDTTRMFIGGNSAGAVLAMHYGYIDSVGQTPPSLQAIINANGGINGNSGNAGYTSKVAAVISLAGGLNDPSWAGIGTTPSFNAAGTADPVVPYDCGYPYGYLPVRLCGLGSEQPYFTSGNIKTSNMRFQNALHVPWDGDANDFHSVDSALVVFMDSNFVTPVSYCGLTSGINEITAQNVDISLFPNPASTKVSVHSSLPVSNVIIYDETGREINVINALNTPSFDVNTAYLSKGIYFMKFETGASTAPIVKRVVIE